MKPHRTDLPWTGSRATVVTTAVVACLLLVSGAGATGSIAATPSFAAGPPLPLGPTPSNAVVADFDRDGSPDLAIANANYFGGEVRVDVRVLVNDGQGRFRLVPGSPFRTGGESSSIVSADFDADGNPDLAVLSSGVRIFQGDGTGRFNRGSLVQLSPPPGNLLTGDLNSDGRPDLITVTGEAGAYTLAVLVNDGSGGFAVHDGPAITGRPDGVSVALGDFNGDARQDLVLARSDSGDLSIFPGDGAGGFGAALLVPAGTGPGDVRASDFNADGNEDLAVSLNSGLEILLGDGTGTFREAGSPLKGVSGMSALTIADLNGDGKPDLAYADGDSSSGAAAVQIGDGAGGFAPAPLSPFYAGWPGALVSADFNGDGRTDLLPLDWGITWGPAPRGNMILFQTLPTPDIVQGRSLPPKADAVLATKQRLWTFAADGKRAVFGLFNCPKPALRVWTPPRRSPTGVANACDAVSDVTIAGNRVAWIENWFGNTHRSYDVFVAPVKGGRTREVDSSGDEDLEMENPEDVSGPWVGALVGGGSILAYNSWSVDCIPPPCGQECQDEGGDGGCEDNNPTLRVEGQQLWSIGARRARAVRGGRRAYPVRAAGGGRIAVEPATGVVLLKPNGSRVSMVPAQKDDPPRGVALSRTHLALLRTFTLDVYDPATGARQHSIALGPAAGLELAGVNSKLALLRGEGHLVLIRLSDGQLVSFPLSAAAIAGFFDVKLTTAGLFYAYNLSRGAKRGRVVFEPLAKLLARF